MADVACWLAISAVWLLGVPNARAVTLSALLEASRAHRASVPRWLLGLMTAAWPLVTLVALLTYRRRS